MYFLVKYIWDSSSESNVIEDCILLRSESVFDNMSHRHWRQHCLFLHGITFLWLIYPFFNVWNPTGPAQVFSPLLRFIVFNYQSSFHTFYSNNTFIPPNYFCTHLNSVQLPWTHRQYISLTRLNKPLLFVVKPKNIHRVSCDLVSAKNVCLCRMYLLDKSVRIVAILLLLWFGYHSTLLQSTLSGIFTSSVFVWRFQIRRTL